MANRASVNQYQNAQDYISDQATRDLKRVWSLGDIYEAEYARQFSEEVFPAAVGLYGDASSAMASEWFEELTGERALAAAPVAYEEARAGALSTLDSLFLGRPDLVISAMSSVLDRMVRQSGRDTVAESALAVGMGYARVPSANACGFCLVLGSQGINYTSYGSASGKGGPFHDNCKCMVIPAVDERDYPPGYDPDALRDMYKQAAKAAGTTDMNDLLVHMREIYGVR